MDLCKAYLEQLSELLAAMYEQFPVPKKKK